VLFYLLLNVLYEFPSTMIIIFKENKKNNR